MSVAAIVLAAGLSSRYRAAAGEGTTKLVARVGGEPMVRRAARTALAAGLRPVNVVTGHARAAVEAALEDLPVAFVHNRDFAQGLATSLAAGLGALPPEAAAAFVLLGDMPLIDVGVLDALVRALTPGSDAAVPLWDGERGNPVLLGRSLFAAAARLTGDEGARRMLRDPALRVVEVPMAHPGVRLDVDDAEGLARANAVA